MENPNPDKVAKVAEIAGKLESAGTVLLADYRGLDVPAQAELRKAVREVGGEFKIYKNTLTKIAAERAGVDVVQHLVGPTAIAFAYAGDDGSAADPVGLSKALTEFAKSNENLVIKGGVVDGATVSVDEVTALSKVPPREEMLAQFAGLLQAPLSKFAGLLEAMPRNFAGLVKALIDKGGTGVAEEAPAAPAAEAPAEDAAAAEAPAQETDAADAEGDADQAPAPAEAATEDAAEAAASDESAGSADADAEQTDDKED